MMGIFGFVHIFKVVLNLVEKVGYFLHLVDPAARQMYFSTRGILCDIEFCYMTGGASIRVRFHQISLHFFLGESWSYLDTHTNGYMMKEGEEAELSSFLKISFN